MKKYNLVVCGGTFDHFHKGHKSLLKLAFSLGARVIIGVTSDLYVENSKFIHSTSSGQNSKFVESFEKRKQQVLEFVKKEEVLSKTKIVKINDLFGPTLDKSLAIDAIVISANTKKGAEVINEGRKKLGLRELSIFVAPEILAEDGKLISSLRIRDGEIDREGKIYIRKEWLDKSLGLTENLRGEFQKPFGELLKDAHNLLKNKNSLVITVGDVTTKTFNAKSLAQNLSVVDFKVAREKKYSSILELGFLGNERVIKVNNPASHITSELFRTLSGLFESGIKRKTILQINGEEDLTVLPLVLISPLNTIIYYGQPGKGLVKVMVSEEIKNKAYNLTLKLKST